MGKELCAVEMDLLRYERQQGYEAEKSAAEERRDTEVKVRELELLAGEFNPLLPDCISEALGEADKDNPLLLQMAEALSQNRDTDAGKILREISQAYWTKRAHEQAEAEQEKQDERDREEAEDNRHFCIDQF